MDGQAIKTWAKQLDALQKGFDTAFGHSVIAGHDVYPGYLSRVKDLDEQLVFKTKEANTFIMDEQRQDVLNTLTARLNHLNGRMNYMLSNKGGAGHDVWDRWSHGEAFLVRQRKVTNEAIVRKGSYSDWGLELGRLQEDFKTTFLNSITAGHDTYPRWRESLEILHDEILAQTRLANAFASSQKQELQSVLDVFRARLGHTSIEITSIKEHEKKASKDVSVRWIFARDKYAEQREGTNEVIDHLT